jgi:hypothetical protein
VFLGTPHRGCEAAEWGSVIAKMGEWTIGCEPRILEALKTHSETLDDLLKDFSRWIWRESATVVCFFENKLTDYGRRFALPTPIATLVSNYFIPSSTSSYILGCEQV